MKSAIGFLAILIISTMAFSVVAASNATVNMTNVTTTTSLNSTNNQTAHVPTKDAVKTVPVVPANSSSRPPVIVPSGIDPVFIAVNIVAAACIIFIISRYLVRDVV